MVDVLGHKPRAAAAAALFLLMLLAPIVPASGGSGEPCPDSDPDPVVDTHVWIESHDGTRLRATLWYNTTQTDTARPVVLAGHGWAGSRADEEGTARWLVDEGYVVLAWDARGFGESEGTVGLDGPDEWADVSEIIDWLAHEEHCPAIVLDDPDDPRLGMAGSSYGGAIQLLAAAQDPRIDAIVPANSWNDLVHSLAPETVVKRGWVDLLYWGGQLASHGLLYAPPNPNTGGMDPRLDEWYLEATTTGRLPDDAIGPLTLRSPREHLHQIQAPVLLTQGYNDTLFLPDEAVANHQVLAAREHAQTHLLLQPVGHGHSMNDAQREAYRAHILQFYDRHLKDDQTDALPPILYYDSDTRQYEHSGTWPPAETAPQQIGLASSQGEETLTLLQLPAPTSHTEWQQFSGEYNTYLDPWVPEHQEPSGVTSVLLHTGLEGDDPLHIAGRPRLTFSVTPHVDEAALFVSLVDAQGRGDIIYNQVIPVFIEGRNGERTEVDVPLSSLAYTLPAEALRVRVTTSDTAFHGARETGEIEIHLEGARLHLPVLP